MKIAVSTGNSRMDKKWNLTEMELEDFRERISKTQRTAETMEQYRNRTILKMSAVLCLGD